MGTTDVVSVYHRGEKCIHQYNDIVVEFQRTTHICILIRRILNPVMNICLFFLFFCFFC